MNQLFQHSNRIFGNFQSWEIFFVEKTEDSSDVKDDPLVSWGFFLSCSYVNQLCHMVWKVLWLGESSNIFLYWSNSSLGRLFTFTLKLSLAVQKMINSFFVTNWNLEAWNENNLNKYFVSWLNLGWSISWLARRLTVTLSDLELWRYFFFHKSSW